MPPGTAEWPRPPEAPRIESAPSLDANELNALLAAVRDGSIAPEEGARRLSEERPGGTVGGLLQLAHSTLDTDREERCGHPEVVYGQGKTPEEVVEIMGALAEVHGRVLATRLGDPHRALLRETFGERVDVDDRARTAVIGEMPEGEGLVAVVSAGTSDGAVAREAVITARFLGAHVVEERDVGVAGLHRILEAAPRIREANTVVVAAGMEGALPSVVGGLVDVPVIAAPTSAGYGASFGGVSALLGMLNSCASGVTVVNIDNGFGAGFAAAQINRQVIRAVARARTS